MSQFENPYASDGTAEVAQPQSTSKLAVSSLVCGLLLCCPVTTLIAPFLGLASLVSMRSNPALKGRGLAISGIVLGVIFTVIWGGGTIWIIRWGIEQERLLNEAPGEALVAGFSGDTAGFKAVFSSRGAGSTDAEVQAFIDELNARYGNFVSAVHDEAAYMKDFTIEKAMNPIQDHPYILTFDNGKADATVTWSQQDPATGNTTYFDMKIIEFIVHDPDLGDITFPGGP